MREQVLAEQALGEPPFRRKQVRDHRERIPQRPYNAYFLFLVKHRDGNPSMATVAPAGRGHALFLETLIINKLQNAAWKRSQKKSTFPRPILKDI